MRDKSADNRALLLVVPKIRGSLALASVATALALASLASGFLALLAFSLLLLDVPSLIAFDVSAGFVLLLRVRFDLLLICFDCLLSSVSDSKTS